MERLKVKTLVEKVYLYDGIDGKPLSEISSKFKKIEEYYSPLIPYIELEFIDYEGPDHLAIYVDREETDEEYNARIEKIRLAELKKLNRLINKDPVKYTNELKKIYKSYFTI